MRNSELHILNLSKRSVKVISVIVLAVMMLTVFGSQVFAVSLPNVTPSAPDGGEQIAGTILNTLMWLGIMIAVGMMIFLGIKYVTASPDGKADLKKQLGIYVLGLVLILAATTIVGMIANAFGK